MSPSKPVERFRWAILLIGVGAVCLIALTGYQALQARDALEKAAEDFELLTGQLADGDGAGARASLASAQAAAQKADDNTGGPGWWLTSQLPGVGDDIVAVRTVADVVKTLATDILPSVIDASEKLKPANLRPVDGRVDLDGIVAVAPSMVDANEALQRQKVRVDSLDPEELSAQLAAPVMQLQDKLGVAVSLSDKASKAVRLLPAMLGADGKRTYLVLFQNNAEVRSTGGIPGAFATITARDGQVAMRQQGSSADVGQLDKPALPLTKEEIALFEEKMGTFSQDINFTPDFPRTAQLAKAMWKKTQGESVDGVISADPVALSYVLEGTGPVTLSDGSQLSADNAAQLLLSQIYADEPDPSVQDQYFADVARNVFDAIAAGQGEPRRVLDGLAHAAGDRRLLVWSGHDEEQQILAPTKLSGALPGKPDANPFVGVFLNDGTGAKMGYYLHYETSVESVSCESGRQHIKVRLTMRSSAPNDAGQVLPDYVIGGGFGAAPGDIRTTVYMYAPLDGRFSTLAIDGRQVSVAELEHQGHPVAASTVDLEPGQKRELTYEVISGLHQRGQANLRVTPGVNGSGLGNVSPSACL